MLKNRNWNDIFQPIPESSDRDSNLQSSFKKDKDVASQGKSLHLLDSTEDPYAGYNFSKLDDAKQRTGYDYLPNKRDEDDDENTVDLKPVKPRNEPVIAKPAPQLSDR